MTEQRERNIPDQGTGGRGVPGRRRRRVPRHVPRIDQEIDLYCNPFVEVYLRFSTHVRKTSRRCLMRITDVVLEFQDNVIFRNVFFVANYTLTY